MEIDPEILVPDENKPWIQAIAPWQKSRRNYLMYYRAVLREIGHIYNVNQNTLFKDLNKKFKDI